ncbi:MAG: exodeoxyribonuclease VII large subunit [Clostridium sp.]|nr:exodeoxyribonuclease VII large subunit [Clostridium sp.]
MRKKFMLWIIAMLIIIVGGVFYKLNSLGNNDENISNEIVLDEKQDDIINIKDVTADIKDKIVTIQGTIINIEEHKNGHLFLTVKDDTGEILVPLFVNNEINFEKIQLNNKYQFKGKVDIFNEKLEVIPEQDSDVNLIVSKGEEITPESVGKNITIDCVILSTYKHPNGHTFLTVKTSANQEMQVPIFNNIGYDGDKLKAGDILRVTGKVEEYKGELEVIPNNNSDIIMCESGEEKTLELKPLDYINEDNRGETIQVRGDVSDLREKDGHLYFYLNDGNIKKECVLYKADGDILEGKRIRIKHASEAKFPIRVSGTVNIYKNKLRLVVDKVYNEY